MTEPVPTVTPPAAPAAPPAPAPEPTPTPTPTPTPVVRDDATPFNSFLDPNGVFQDGWREALVPEDLRGREVYQAVVDLPGLFKQLGHQDLVLKRQGKGIMPLSEDATETERELYFEALGRPKTPDDYEIKAPEGLEEYYDEALLKEARGALHVAGLTQDQVNAVMALDAKRITDGITQSEEAEAVERKEAETTLRRKWGEAYDERLALANRMIAENALPDNEEKILEAIGNDPHVADFLANIAKKFMEGKLISAAAPTKQTPGEADAKMKELIAEQQADPRMKVANPAKYDRLTKEINQLAAASLATGGTPAGE